MYKTEFFPLPPEELLFSNCSIIFIFPAITFCRHVVQCPFFCLIYTWFIISRGLKFSLKFSINPIIFPIRWPDFKYFNSRDLALTFQWGSYLPFDIR